MDLCFPNTFIVMMLFLFVNRLFSLILKKGF